MLVKRENLNNIFELYKNSFDNSFVVALPNFDFAILRKGVIKHLRLDEVAFLFNKEYSSLYDEYMKLYPIEEKVEVTNEESTSQSLEKIETVEETKPKKEKTNAKRDS